MNWWRKSTKHAEQSWLMTWKGAQSRSAPVRTLEAENIEKSAEIHLEKMGKFVVGHGLTGNSHMKQVFSMKIAMCLKISRFRSWETAPCPLWEFASKKLAANALHWRQGGCCLTWNLDFRKVHFRYFSAVPSFWGNWRQGKTLASCRAEMGTRKRVLKLV